MTGFDPYARRYEELLAENVRGTGFRPAYFHERKAREVARWLEREGRREDALRLLDYGCGIGAIDPFLRRVLPHATLLGVDPSAASIAEARRRNGWLPDCHYAVLDEEGGALPFQGPFDVIFIANVLHHVPPPERASLLARLAGSLAPGGHFFVFEHNPRNPLTVRAVERCPFDEDAVLLPPTETRDLLTGAGLALEGLQYVVFFPGWLSWLVPCERLLGWLPLGAQYLAVARDGAARSRERVDDHG